MSITRAVKVLRVIARLNVGGPAIHVINLTRGLDATRFESTLVTGTENPGEGSMLDLALEQGVKPVVIPEIVGQATLKPRDLKALIALYRLMRRERPQVVHTHAAKPGVLGRVAARLAGVPVVVHTFHGHILHGYYGPWMSWLLRRMERMLAHLSDRIIAVSEQVKQDLVRYGVAPPEKICVIPLGLELDPFLDGDVHRGALRRELGVPSDVPLVGIVGRIFPIKNHRLFLGAAALVAAKEPGARFVVVGDGTLRADMEALARELDIGERTIFTGWRRDLPKVYADLDVLVVSSDNEGTPVSAIEAMASGCPVVATRVGGLPDLIEDAEVGHLVAPRDAEAMAGAILGLLGDGDRARRMGQSARRRVQDRYRAERLCGDIEALYTELLVPEEGFTRDRESATGGCGAEAALRRGVRHGGARGFGAALGPGRSCHQARGRRTGLLSAGALGPARPAHASAQVPHDDHQREPRRGHGAGDEGGPADHARGPGPPGHRLRRDSTAPEHLEGGDELCRAARPAH